MAEDEAGEIKKCKAQNEITFYTELETNKTRVQQNHDQLDDNKGIQETQQLCLQEIQESCLQAIQESCLQEIQESGLKEIKKSGLQEIQESCLQEIQESGLQAIQESFLQEIQESGLQEIQESGLKEIKKSGLQEIQKCLQEVLESGVQETQESEGGEDDLPKLSIRCTKNPGHKNFIPVDAFTLNHLPEGHRDEDLYEFIKVTADLTVRVDVKLISQHRPEFWPNTKVQYPYFNMPGKKLFRTGSGRVSGVHQYIDGYRTRSRAKHWKNYIKCWCKKCQQADTTSHVWWEFNVDTATHVVFDDTEASQTSVRLFYDKKDSIKVSVDQAFVVIADADSDWCRLTFVTCDEQLGERLTSLDKRFVDAWRSSSDKYISCRDEVKLSFIVSHPHGCAKRITIGHWVDKWNFIKYRDGSSRQFTGNWWNYSQEGGDILAKFSYTTSTCPGSSGAFVHCLGYGDRQWYYQLVHIGSLKSKLNYSGSGHI